MAAVISLCFCRQTVKRAATVALVVGTVLNLINHPEILFAAALTSKSLLQILLTYLVPYLVSTHGQIAGASKA
jgi:hypothetical protein